MSYLSALCAPLPADYAAVLPTNSPHRAAQMLRTRKCNLPADLIPISDIGLYYVSLHSRPEVLTIRHGRLGHEVLSTQVCPHTGKVNTVYQSVDSSLDHVRACAAAFLRK